MATLKDRNGCIIVDGDELRDVNTGEVSYVEENQKGVLMQIVNIPLHGRYSNKLSDADLSSLEVM